MAFKKGTEVATIDVVLVTIETKSGIELALDTANKIAAEIASNTTDAVQLIIKGKLVSQKKAETTITGHDLTLTDNVFNYELAKILQGGKLYYWADEEQTEMTEDVTEYGIAGYDSPISGSGDHGEVFELNTYSACYNSAGIITEYERVTYPNCTGDPFGLTSEDGVFRVSEYTVHSAPDKGQAPYSLRRVKTLPNVN